MSRGPAWEGSRCAARDARLRSRHDRNAGVLGDTPLNSGAGSACWQKVLRQRRAARGWPARTSPLRRGRHRGSTSTSPASWHPPPPSPFRRGRRRGSAAASPPLRTCPLYRHSDAGVVAGHLFYLAAPATSTSSRAPWRLRLPSSAAPFPHRPQPPLDSLLPLAAGSPIPPLTGFSFPLHRCPARRRECRWEGVI